jgi:hypothetical protein
MSVTGRWRIVEMDLWDLEAIDLLGPAFIEFRRDRTGEFRFIAVEGWMDCANGERDGRPNRSDTLSTGSCRATSKTLYYKGLVVQASCH